MGKILALESFWGQRGAVATRDGCLILPILQSEECVRRRAVTRSKRRGAARRARSSEGQELGGPQPSGDRALHPSARLEQATLLTCRTGKQIRISKMPLFLLRSAPMINATSQASSFRSHDALREVQIERGYLESNPASVLYRSGKTIVLCTASVETNVPPWMAGRGKGWVTAEYNMLPGSTSPRKNRDRGGKVDGRTTEIQRLIGRSLRAVVNLEALGERSITVDCDVLQADGGTRTASITGGYIALSLAVTKLAAIPLLDPPVVVTDVLPRSVAAVSVGVIDGDIVLDLDYKLDSAADVDMNVVMTGDGRFIEIQGTGEEATFDDEQLSRMLGLAKKGIRELTQKQADAIRLQ